MFGWSKHQWGLILCSYTPSCTFSGFPCMSWSTFGCYLCNICICLIKRKWKCGKVEVWKLLPYRQKKIFFYVKEGNGHFKNYEEVVKGRRMNGEMETIFFSFWEEFSTSSITETRNITGWETHVIVVHFRVCLCSIFSFFSSWKSCLNPLF